MTPETESNAAQPPNSTASADSKPRERASNLFRRAARLEISDTQLVAALGVSLTYFDRLRAEASNPDRETTDSAKTFLNARTLTALEGICDLVESSQVGGRETAVQYTDRILAEMATLKAGDIHTLVTIPPPLERDSARVRRAVIEAAHRGVEFVYYYPSAEAVKAVFAVIDRKKAQPARDAANRTKRIDTTTHVLSWMSDIEKNIELVMQSLLLEAAKLDLERAGRNGSGEFTDALVTRVRFWPLEWIWISFNEKLVMIGRDNTYRIIRKEILMPRAESAHLPVYGGDQSWMWVKFPTPGDSLAAVLHTSRAAEARNWKALSTT